MKGRVEQSITRCLLVAVTALIVSSVGCQRAKPARVVTPPPPSTMRAETPAIARVAEAAATATADAAITSAGGYPAPAQPTPAAGGLGAHGAYPPTASPVSPATPEPTAEPTAEPSPAPTQAPTPEPTATVASQVAPPTPVPEVLYRVKAGDSLGSIAVLYNTTAAAIMARNGLRDPSLIRVGQTLIIPATSPETLPTGSTVRHTVRTGETLADIARYYRTTAEAIVARNPTLADPQRLAEGVVVQVMVGSESGGRAHVVRVGESLSEIAEQYGVTTQSVARANGLTDPSLIRVGQTLIIP